MSFVSDGKSDKMPEQATATIVIMRARSGAEELDRLNRMTGLAFDTLPTSLIESSGGLQLAEEDGEELIFRALYLWDEAKQQK